MLQVSLSSAVMPMVKMVPRGFTAAADAYLTPHILRCGLLRPARSPCLRSLLFTAGILHQQQEPDPSADPADWSGERLLMPPRFALCSVLSASKSMLAHRIAALYRAGSPGDCQAARDERMSPTPCHTAGWSSHCRYIHTFQSGFDEGLPAVNLSFMQSDGGLAPVSQFSGHRAILSGPAGGCARF